jgi:hypothetical protein
MASTDPAYPNSVISVNPVTSTVENSVVAGSGPNLLSISSDSSFLWAGLNGDYAVQRFLLPGLTKDVSFQMPSTQRGGTQQAVCLEAAPVNPHTIALIAGSWTITPPGNGVYVYDDTAQRSTSVPGWGAGGGPEIDWIQWGSDDSTIYGDEYSTIDTGGISKLSINSTGVTYVATYGGTNVLPGIMQYNKSNGLLYGNDAAYLPGANGPVGEFNLPGPGYVACTADSSLGRYFCATGYDEGNSNVALFELWVYDLNSYAFINRVNFGWRSEGTGSGTALFTGEMQYLVRWGNAGLALTTVDTGMGFGNGGVFLFDGNAINPNLPPDVSTGTLGSPCLDETSDCVL